MKQLALTFLLLVQSFGNPLVILGGNGQVVAANTFLTGLVNYWNLDEVSGDRAPSHGALTLTDNNTVGSVAGKNGNAADFVSSSSESLSGAYSSPTLPLTVSLWAKVDDTASNTFFQIVKTDQNNDYISVESSTAYNGDNRGNGNTVEAAGWSRCSGGTVETTSFHHIVYVATNTASYALYVDGVQVDTSTVSATVTAGMNLIAVGAARDSTPSYSNSSVDEVAVWSRALSGAEVTLLYNSGAGLFYADFE